MEEELFKDLSPIPDFAKEYVLAPSFNEFLERPKVRSHKLVDKNDALPWINYKSQYLREPTPPFEEDPDIVGDEQWYWRKGHPPHTSVLGNFTKNGKETQVKVSKNTSSIGRKTTFSFKGSSIPWRRWIFEWDELPGICLVYHFLDEKGSVDKSNATLALKNYANLQSVPDVKFFLNRAIKLGAPLNWKFQLEGKFDRPTICIITDGGNSPSSHYSVEQTPAYEGTKRCINVTKILPAARKRGSEQLAETDFSVPFSVVLTKGEGDAPESVLWKYPHDFVLFEQEPADAYQHLSSNLEPGVFESELSECIPSITPIDLGRAHNARDNGKWDILKDQVNLMMANEVLQKAYHRSLLHLFMDRDEATAWARNGDESRLIVRISTKEKNTLAVTSWNLSKLEHKGLQFESGAFIGKRNYAQLQDYLTDRFKNFSVVINPKEFTLEENLQLPSRPVRSLLSVPLVSIPAAAADSYFDASMSSMSLSDHPQRSAVSDFGGETVNLQFADQNGIFQQFTVRRADLMQFCVSQNQNR